MNRTYALLDVKSADADRRQISGIATTPDKDRMGDVIEPLGASFRPTMPLLLHHNSALPVGEVRLGRPTTAGIPFTADFPDPDQIRSTTLRERVMEALDSVRHNLIRAVSIGFRPLDDGIELLKSGGFRFTKYEILELSLVAIPANEAATILTAKSFDAPHLLAASGVDVAPVSLSGVADVSTRPARKGARPMTKTYAEQIKDFEHTRAARDARMAELMTRSADAGETLDDAQSEEYDGLEAEIKKIDEHLVRLRGMDERAKKAAVPVAGDTPAAATASRNGTGVITVKDTLPKGTLFTRYAMAVAAGKGSRSDTLAFAQRWDGQTPEVSAYIKAVEGTTTGTSPGWGAELVYQTNLASEFVELLRPATIVGRITGIRRVPFGVRIPVQTGGSTVNWVGEAAPKPVGQLAFDTVLLGYNKIAGIVVLTEELVRFSSPSAEETVRRDLVEQIARFMDAQFITPSVAPGANNPASITYGVSATGASGTDADALYADLNAAMATFDGTDLGTNSLVVITTPAVARGISTLRNPLGQFEFAGVNMAGGTLLGFPVIVSNTVPAGYLIVIKADEVFMAEDPRVMLDASNQATLDMSGGTTPDFNLWQRNCVGIRAEQFVTWAKRRPDAVAVISGASYGPAVGSP